MDHKQLMTFKTAAETLNFTKTARILNFAQSSVTAQIKTLEKELATPLFERLGKRLLLTQEGKEFKLYAEQMIKLSEEAKLAISGNNEPSGTLIIGAQESQCTYRLPVILKNFKDQYPNVKLIFKPAHSDESTREQLINGMLDVAFIMDITKPEEALTIKPLIQENIKLVAYPGHALASKSAVFLKDIELETLLLTEKGCSYRTLLENACYLENVYPINKFEFGSIEAIKQCVIAGLGIAALPTMVVEQEVKNDTMVELNWHHSIPPIFTHIAWHKDKWMSPPLEDFIQLTQKSFREKLFHHE